MKSMIEAWLGTGKGAGVIRSLAAMTAMSAAMMTAGCIQVRAPDKPIEINLNVNVKQEVVVRLQKDADAFIDKNPELFPQ
jgi:hypothetical protein